MKVKITNPEMYFEALACLQDDIALPLGQSNCPWLDNEECVVDMLRQTISHTSLQGETSRQKDYEAGMNESFACSFGMMCDY